MKVSPEQMEEIRNRIQNKPDDLIKPDDSRVIIAEMQLNALAKMADEKNEIFSQVRSDEVFNVSRAMQFSKNCLPSVSERLKKKYGVDMVFDLPELQGFIQENFKHLQKADRKRAGEYLEGLKALQQKNVMMEDTSKKSLLSRMI